MSISRQDAIRNRLAAFLLEAQGCAVVCPNRSSWQAFSLNGPYRFGWAPPMPVDDDSMLLVVPFCPELMAATTAHLADDDLNDYLGTVEFFMRGFIGCFGQDVVELRQRLEDRLLATNPKTLTLLSAVEAHALDEGIVA